MAHLTPEQFVDIADGVIAETGSAVAPHLATCVECRRQLSDMRAILTEAADVDVPDPSPLFWDHLSARVHDAVEVDAARRRSWQERLLRPLVLVPSLAGALAATVIVVSLSRPALAPAPIAPPPTLTTTVTASSSAIDRASRAPVEPSLPPLGAADDPQLGLVADFGTTLDWDEMREEMALSNSPSSSDSVFELLTVDEQRALQRLLADEMVQSAARENRS